MTRKSSLLSCGADGEEVTAAVCEFLFEQGVVVVQRGNRGGGGVCRASEALNGHRPIEIHQQDQQTQDSPQCASEDPAAMTIETSDHKIEPLAENSMLNHAVAEGGKLSLLG